MKMKPVANLDFQPWGKIPAERKKYQKLGLQGSGQKPTRESDGELAIRLAAEEDQR
jgi:hypothetical protein